MYFKLLWSSPLKERSAAGGNTIQNTLWLAVCGYVTSSSPTQKVTQRIWKKSNIKTHGSLATQLAAHSHTTWEQPYLGSSAYLCSPAACHIPIPAERTTPDTWWYREVNLVGARFQLQSSLSLPPGCLPSYNGHTPILPSCETTAFVHSKKSGAGAICKYRFVPWCCFWSYLLRKWNEYPRIHERVDPVTYPE